MGTCMIREAKGKLSELANLTWSNEWKSLHKRPSIFCVVPFLTYIICYVSLINIFFKLPSLFRLHPI